MIIFIGTHREFCTCLTSSAFKNNNRPTGRWPPRGVKRVAVSIKFKNLSESCIVYGYWRGLPCCLEEEGRENELLQKNCTASKIFAHHSSKLAPSLCIQYDLVSSRSCFLTIRFCHSESFCHFVQFCHSLSLLKKSAVFCKVMQMTSLLLK